jgi:threonine synthase
MSLNIPRRTCADLYGPTMATLANAMDVGDPSNAGRLLDLHRDVEELRRIARAYSVTDEEIARTIRGGCAESGEVFDPHTATAVTRGLPCRQSRRPGRLA